MYGEEHDAERNDAANHAAGATALTAYAPYTVFRRKPPCLRSKLRSKRSTQYRFCAYIRFYNKCWGSEAARPRYTQHLLWNRKRGEAVLCQIGLRAPHLQMAKILQIVACFSSEFSFIDLTIRLIAK